MQKNIHPKWHNDCKVTCSCGNTFTTGSTLTEIEVEICDQCHPFFTGEMKFVDRQGRVDKFKKKMQMAQKKKAQKQKQKQTKQTTQKQGDDKSYQDILREAKDEIRQTEAETETK